MNAIIRTWRATLSLQNILLVLAITFGFLAIASESALLIKGINLVWENSGYVSLILGPLTLLLAYAVLQDISTRSTEQKVLVRQYGIITSLSPMAGFLGTVIGIMGAIQSLGNAENAESLIEMVGHTFDSMAVAFTTTAWGLVLAMIAVLMQRLKKESVEISPDQKQRQQIIDQLKDIGSSLNEILPTAQKTFEENHHDGGQYEKIKS